MADILMSTLKFHVAIFDQSSTTISSVRFPKGEFVHKQLLVQHTKSGPSRIGKILTRTPRKPNGGRPTEEPTSA